MKIAIDVGHTCDKAREHPSAFTMIDWTTGRPGEIARKLGFGKNTSDSLEHMLNKAVGTKLKEKLCKAGHYADLIDFPGMSNNPEIGKVISTVNAGNYDVLISIHANAQGGPRWKCLGGSAKGTVVLYYSKSTKGKQLAEKVANTVRATRAKTHGKDNRCDIITASTLPIVRDTNPVAILVETCFYDNLDDLEWCVNRIEDLCDSLVSCL